MCLVVMAHTHTHTHQLAHAHMHAHTHTHTHAHAHTRTRTHTHTHMHAHFQTVSQAMQPIHDRSGGHRGGELGVWACVCVCTHNARWYACV